MMLGKTIGYQCNYLAIGQLSEYNRSYLLAIWIQMRANGCESRCLLENCTKVCTINNIDNDSDDDHR